VSQRQRSLPVRSSTKPRRIVSGPDFVPESGSDHAVSIALSVNASSSAAVQLDAERRGRSADQGGRLIAVRTARPCMCRALIGRCRMAGRARVLAETCRTVRAPLPHHSTACRSDRSSSPLQSLSAAHPRRASPCRGPLRLVHRARSARRPQDLRAGVPGRHVPCAVPPGHPTPTDAPLASSTDDSSLDFSSLESFTRPKPQTRALSGHARRSGAASRTPGRFQDPLCHTPSAPAEVPRVGVTAEAGGIAFSGCDHEPA
jgi:hypothetical protein